MKSAEKCVNRKYHILYDSLFAKIGEIELNEGIRRAVLSRSILSIENKNNNHQHISPS